MFSWDYTKWYGLINALFQTLLIKWRAEKKHSISILIQYTNTICVNTLGCCSYVYVFLHIYCMYRCVNTRMYIYVHVLYSEYVFIPSAYSECMVTYSSSRANTWHIVILILIWNIFRFLLWAFYTVFLVLEHSDKDGSIFSHYSVYSAMSNVIFRKPSSLLFFPLVFYVCYPDYFIILCGLLLVSDCVYRLSEKRSIQGSKCPWPRGRAVDISYASGALSHDRFYSSEKRQRLLLCFCPYVNFYWTKQTKTDYLTLVHQKKNHVNLEYLSISNSQCRVKDLIQKQLLYRNCFYV